MTRKTIIVLGRVLIATETSVIPNSSVIPTCLVCFLRLSKLEVFFASILSA